MHQHKWWIKNRVFFNEYNGQTTADDLVAMSEANLEYLENSDAPLVHCIVNIENMTQVPLNIRVVQSGTVKSLRHPKMGWLIAYGKSDKMMSFIAQAVTQIFKTRYRLVDTYQEAVEFLQSVDATLPDLSSMTPPSV